ncbi:MAG TPA: hypothetical protein VGK48_04720 [Terriglobia bacterium]
MKLETFPTPPRFKIGDGVLVLAPGSDKGREGVISGVIGHTGDFVYRYDVLLADGKAKRFFGFEIELIVRRTA